MVSITLSCGIFENIAFACYLSCMAHHTALLNQAHAGHRLARTWFLEIVPVWTSVCVFVCVFVCTQRKLGRPSADKVSGRSISGRNMVDNIRMGSALLRHRIAGAGFCRAVGPTKGPH